VKGTLYVDGWMMRKSVDENYWSVEGIIISLITRTFHTQEALIIW